MNPTKADRKYVNPRARGLQLVATDDASILRPAHMHPFSPHCMALYDALYCGVSWTYTNLFDIVVQTTYARIRPQPVVKA